MATQPEQLEVQGEFDLFAVSLPVFEGPFDLLLSLIARKKLDITEVALAQVTDEFIAFMHASPDLSRTSEFLVVAATLLDMKAARLLPQVDEEAGASEADLEARDLLFSRLLQYRAYKEASKDIGRRLIDNEHYVPREVPLEAHFAVMLPPLAWTTTPQDLARLAADALTFQSPTVEVSHLHDPVVPVREQVLVLSAMLAREGRMTFAELVCDAARPVLVSRFLALLELYRDGAVEFDQEAPLAPLLVSWRGRATGDGHGSEASSERAGRRGAGASVNEEGEGRGQ